MLKIDKIYKTYFTYTTFESSTNIYINVNINDIEVQCCNNKNQNNIIINCEL